MRLTIDEDTYHMNLHKLIELYRHIYTQASTPEGLLLPDGKTIKIPDSSLKRTLIKSAMTPYVIPLINDMATAFGIVIEPPEKHCDLIDYSVNALLDILIVIQERIDVNLASRTNEDSSKAIVAITPTIRGATKLIDSDSQENSTENT